PVTIRAALNGTPPVLVAKVPVDRVTKPVRKRGFRAKAQLARQFVGAGGISSIMSRTILDERYELASTAATGGRTARETDAERLVHCDAAIELVEEQPAKIDIRHFGVTAYIVGLTKLPTHQHKRNSGAVVPHEQPVADIAAVAVDRQFLPVYRVDNQQ